MSGILTLFLTLCFLAPARAQPVPSYSPPPAAAAPPEPMIDSEPNPSRTLDGHSFLPFAVVPWPFVAAQLTSRTGLGISDLDVIPVITVGGGDMPVEVESQTLSSDAKLVTFAQTFEGAIPFTRWLALSIAMSTGSAVGVNESGAFNYGVNYAFGGLLGAVARLAAGPNWYLSTRLDGTSVRLGAIVPARLTESITVEEDGVAEFDAGTVAVLGNRLSGSYALMLAANPAALLGLKKRSLFGLQSSAGVDVTRDTLAGTSVRRTDVVGGLGISTRLNELDAPLAMLVGGKLIARVDSEGPAVLASSLTSQGKVRGSLETALYYSKPDEIDAGLSVLFEFSDKERRTIFRLVINRFW